KPCNASIAFRPPDRSLWRWTSKRASGAARLSRQQPRLRRPLRIVLERTCRTHPPTDQRRRRLQEAVTDKAQSITRPPTVSSSPALKTRDRSFALRTKRRGFYGPPEQLRFEDIVGDHDAIESSQPPPDDHTESAFHRDRISE